MSQTSQLNSLNHKLGGHLEFLFCLLPTYIKKITKFYQVYFLNCFQIHSLLPILSIIILNHYYSLLPGLPAPDLSISASILALTHFIHSFIHSFNKNFPGAYYMPSPALGSGPYLVFSVVSLKCTLIMLFSYLKSFDLITVLGIKSQLCSIAYWSIHVMAPM